MMTPADLPLIHMTAALVEQYVLRNRISVNAISGLITGVHQALWDCANPPAPEPAPLPKMKRKYVRRAVQKVEPTREPAPAANDDGLPEIVLGENGFEVVSPSGESERLGEE